MEKAEVQKLADTQWEAWRPGLKNAPMPDIIWNICSEYTGAHHDVFCKRIFAKALQEVSAFASFVHLQPKDSK